MPFVDLTADGPLFNTIYSCALKKGAVLGISYRKDQECI